MAEPSSKSKLVSEDQDSESTPRSAPAKSPTKSLAKSQSPPETLTPLNPSPNHGPQQGGDEMGVEEALEDLQDDDQDAAATSGTTLQSLRNFGLQVRGPEDYSWLTAASRPAFSVTPASQPVQPPQQTEGASPHRTDPPQQDRAAAPRRLLPTPDIRQNPRASTRHASRAQSSVPLSLTPSLPPRPRATTHRSDDQNQGAEPTRLPVDLTPARPSVRTLPDPSRARQPLPQQLPLFPQIGQGYNIWPSQDVVYGDSTARSAFLGSSFQSFGGGEIFAALRQQSTIVQSDSAWRKQTAAAAAGAAADVTKVGRRTAENRDRSTKPGKKTQPKNKRPGEFVWDLKESTKKARIDDGAQASEQNHNVDDRGEHEQRGDGNQATNAQKESPRLPDTNGPEKEVSDAEDAFTLEEENETIDNDDREEHSSEHEDSGARTGPLLYENNGNSIVEDRVRSFEAAVALQALSKDSVHRGGNHQDVGDNA